MAKKTTSQRLAPYNPAKIEKKWQKKWAADKIYRTEEAGSKEKGGSKDKFYILDMFPYPSGDGLHVGHPKGYIATDVISRMKRMQGMNVLHPMGFDAFGLPAENYAIKMKTNPMVAVAKNVQRFKEQLEILGFDYDWSREVNTTDPAYYRWTQWIFLQLFKKGLAYESYEPVNWCPTDKTVLANEDVENGRCERCGTPVEKKPLRQWVLKITDYADRLLRDLDADDYVMPKLIDKVNPHQPGAPLVKRHVAHAIVYDPKAQKYLIIRNKKFGWDTVVIGGIEGDERPEETARREVREETGYTDLEFKRILGGPTEAHYHTKHKGENRVAIAQAAYFELKSDGRVPIVAESMTKGEVSHNEILWVVAEDFVPGKMVNSELPIWLERMRDPAAGWPKPLLDWPESIKEAQRNWIGRSEGAEIDFRLAISEDKKEILKAVTPSVTVYTTRPDTLFGVTYLVLAPEHPWVQVLLPQTQNKAEIEAYVARAKSETEIERTDANKEKTGVELKGVKAINPANNEEVPVWIADYVLADYGTGAVMAVPAHDDRDFAFAKKFKLPIRQVIAWETGTKRPNEERRDGGCAVIFDPNTQKYAFGRLPEGKYDLFGGGVGVQENLVEGILREVEEESGLHHFSYKETIDDAFVHYHNSKKKIDRVARATCLLLILQDDALKSLKQEKHEDYTLVWSEPDKIIKWWEENNHMHDYDHWIIFLKNGVTRAVELEYDRTNKIYDGSARPFTGEGTTINSGSFSDKSSDSVKKDITAFVGGRWVMKYKLRDWVFSRQRYWGEPIPLIHCGKCGVVPVPEKDLPVELPKVKSYEPTGTGESPLAAIKSWVNVKCPKCKGPARRETNTMPQWAGSCWYYLRYEDPNNRKALVDPKKEKYWSPVDLYVGGAEHATRHLIYARFWHKFLNDIGVVSTSEPFTKLQSVGLIMGEDGRKMSKRFGNVVNPDDIVAQFGADTLRIYEMFMGPFDQSIAWSTESMVGPRRFIERVWKLAERVEDSMSHMSPDESVKKVDTLEKEPKENILPAGTRIDRVLQKTIKKVTEDIGAMRFNTAISSLMIALNELEKTASGPDQSPAISRSQFESYLKLLAPFAPHVTEELWISFGNKKSIHTSEWPEYDPKLIVDSQATIAVQINGKMRGTFTAATDTPEEAIKSAALALPEAKKWLEGKEIRKIIVVKGKLLSIVTN